MLFARVGDRRASAYAGSEGGRGSHVLEVRQATAFGTSQVARTWGHGTRCYSRIRLSVGFGLNLRGWEVGFVLEKSRGSFGVLESIGQQWGEALPRGVREKWAGFERNLTRVGHREGNPIVCRPTVS